MFTWTPQKDSSPCPSCKGMKHPRIEALISVNALLCNQCGVELTKQLDDGPFHIPHTQLVRMSDEKDFIVEQIDQMAVKVQNLFTWIDQDELQKMKVLCLDTILRHGIRGKKNQVKYAFSAITFNFIRTQNRPNQVREFRQLRSEFDIKKFKHLLTFLNLLQNTQLPCSFEEQVKHFENKLLDYFREGGSSLLLEFKLLEENKDCSYQELRRKIVMKVLANIRDLYKITDVQHFCESKKPSHLVISLGQMALQITGIFIPAAEYSRIFDIKLPSLKYFEQGLREKLVQLIQKYRENPIRKKICTNLSQESQSVNIGTGCRLEPINYDNCSTLSFMEDCSDREEIVQKELRLITSFFKKDLEQYVSYSRVEKEINELERLYGECVNSL